MVQVVGRVPLLQSTFLEYPDLIADREGFLLVVGHQNRTGATALEDVTDFVAELAAQFTIEVGEGFIEQQQLRLRCQCAGQGYPLLLAAGEFVGEALAEVLQVHQFEHLGGDPVFVRMLANAEGDVVCHAQVREQCVVLEHHADPPFLRREGETGAGDGLSRQLDFPFVDGFKAGDGSQGGGLATAGGAEQAANVAGIEVQVEVLYNALVLVAAGQVAQVQQ